MPNKESWWRQRKEVYYTLQDVPREKAEGALSSSSAIFGVQTWATGLNRQKNWEQGTKVCIVKQFSHRCSCDLQSSLGQAGGLVQFWKVITGRSNLVPVWENSWDKCPHWNGGSSRELQFIVMRYYQFCPFLDPRWLWSDCKENGWAQRQIQNGDNDAKVFLLLVNLWAQVRSQYFSAKAAWVPLTMT
jgi:hypothetical protein